MYNRRSFNSQHTINQMLSRCIRVNKAKHSTVTLLNELIKEYGDNERLMELVESLDELLNAESLFEASLMWFDGIAYLELKDVLVVSDSDSEEGDE